MTTKAWSIIDWNKKTYSLCDTGNCQEFGFTANADGIYVDLTIPGRELMVKVNVT